MVKTAFTYSIKKSVLTQHAPSGCAIWDVFKVDEDFNLAASYRVTETTKDGQIEYNCGCPSYKPFCKHIHWVKSLKLKMRSDPKIIGGVFDPASNDWIRLDRTT